MFNIFDPCLKFHFENHIDAWCIENCDLKVGLDFGQKFLKICLSLIETESDNTQLNIGLELAKIEVKIPC